MTVSVVVPYRAGCPHRDAAWHWVRARYAALGWEIVTGESAEGPFNRAEAILDGARRAAGDVLVVADADSWCAGVTDAADQVAGGVSWAVPHWFVYRLSQASTLRVLAGAPWRGLALSDDNAQDRRRYRGNETGTLVVIHRDVLFDVPPDVRFVGWGQEDVAWALALRVLVGAPQRGDAELVHLWHPPQPRMNRVIGSPESRALLDRYRVARNRGAMTRLLEEVR